jgi:hypothetical protein
MLYLSIAGKLGTRQLLQYCDHISSLDGKKLYLAIQKSRQRDLNHRSKSHLLIFQPSLNV